MGSGKCNGMDHTSAYHYFVVAVSGIKTAITGGTVKATGGNGRYVGGYGFRLPSMSISGGTVIAQGGTGDIGGTGILFGTISGGKVTAQGGKGESEDEIGRASCRERV